MERCYCTSHASRGVLARRGTYRRRKPFVNIGFERNCDSEAYNGFKTTIHADATSQKSENDADFRKKRPLSVETAGP